MYGAGMAFYHVNEIDFCFAGMFMIETKYPSLSIIMHFGNKRNNFLTRRVLSSETFFGDGSFGSFFFLPNQRSVSIEV